VKAFAAIALSAVAAGTAAWWVFEKPPSAPQAIAPAALWAVTLADTRGRPQSLGQFRGHIVVANFWATWCAPCREEMPTLVRAQTRWAPRDVRVIGLTADSPEAVERFGHELGVNYPLLVGKGEIDEIARRLGNSQGVLPYTAIVDAEGRVVATKVGAYSEAELDAVLEGQARKITERR